MAKINEIAISKLIFLTSHTPAAAPPDGQAYLYGGDDTLHCMLPDGSVVSMVPADVAAGVMNGEYDVLMIADEESLPDSPTSGWIRLAGVDGQVKAITSSGDVQTMVPQEVLEQILAGEFAQQILANGATPAAPGEDQTALFADDSGRPSGINHDGTVYQMLSAAEKSAIEASAAGALNASNTALSTANSAAATANSASASAALAKTTANNAASLAAAAKSTADEAMEKAQEALNNAGSGGGSGEGGVVGETITLSPQPEDTVPDPPESGAIIYVAENNRPAAIDSDGNYYLMPTLIENYTIGQNAANAANAAADAHRRIGDVINQIDTLDNQVRFTETHLMGVSATASQALTTAQEALQLAGGGSGEGGGGGGETITLPPQETTPDAPTEGVTIFAGRRENSDVDEPMAIDSSGDIRVMPRHEELEALEEAAHDTLLDGSSVETDDDVEAPETEFQTRLYRLEDDSRPRAVGGDGTRYAMPTADELEQIGSGGGSGGDSGSSSAKRLIRSMDISGLGPTITIDTDENTELFELEEVEIIIAAPTGVGDYTTPNGMSLQVTINDVEAVSGHYYYADGTTRNNYWPWFIQNNATMIHATIQCYANMLHAEVMSYGVNSSTLGVDPSLKTGVNIACQNHAKNELAFPNEAFDKIRKINFTLNGFQSDGTFHDGAKLIIYGR